MTQATDDNLTFPSLFTHSLRKEWGVGVLAWEAGGKRGYLFENGEERTMASGFHELMCRVEQPSPEQAEAYARLRRVLAARGLAGAAAGQTGPRFLDQLVRLHQTYPSGLQDRKWIEEIRGEGSQRRDPWHRHAMIQEAQEQLSCTNLDAQLNSQRFGPIVAQIASVLGHTDLVPSAQLKKLKSVDPEQLRTLAHAARELLYGKAAYDQRFERHLAALATVLREPPRWEMATALSAIVHPTQHICVQLTFFRQQLKALGSRETAAVRPSAVAYTKLLNVSRTLSNKLADQGETPRDLMDTYDFIRITLKPAPKVRAPKPKRAAASKSAAPAADADTDTDTDTDDE